MKKQTRATKPRRELAVKIEQGFMSRVAAQCRRYGGLKSLSESSGVPYYSLVMIQQTGKGTPTNIEKLKLTLN